jgi:uracil-DNA glycosylase
MLKNLIPKSYADQIQWYLEGAAFDSLSAFINSENGGSSRIFPSLDRCFAALEMTPFGSVKVVVIGQDPYHGFGEANGLAFSVSAGVKIPPSLKNIFLELRSDLGCPEPRSGDLTLWAEQGVLLLNSTLTVRENQPGSHFNQGWETLTDAIIMELAKVKRPKVFILWGAKAQQKKKLIQSSQHQIIESPHPSPLSSYRGFFGSKPFSKANEYLISQDCAPISWCLPGRS